MTQLEEKQAQIEAALRRRFFQYVPHIEKPERSNWTDQQHDTDRLTRALAAYALVKHCGIDDVTASGAVVDGSDDGGIDALWVDTLNRRLICVQSKFRRSGTAPSQEEVLKTRNGVEDLLERNFEHFNKAIRDLSTGIKALLQKPGVRIEIVMIYLGNAFSPHARRDLNRFCDDKRREGCSVSWHDEGGASIYEGLVREQAARLIDVDLTLEHSALISHPHLVFYGQIKAEDLARLVQQHGPALFERNIRHYLGRRGINTAIEETMLKFPSELFYLNNGITAIATKIEEIIPI